LKQSKFLFGDIVVVDGCNIGVIVKSWKNPRDDTYNYDVYVRMYNCTKLYEEDAIDRYRVRHKYLDEQEIEWQLG
jgi:hypothetical protein